MSGFAKLKCDRSQNLCVTRGHQYIRLLLLDQDHFY